MELIVAVATALGGVGLLAVAGSFQPPPRRTVLASSDRSIAVKAAAATVVGLLVVLSTRWVLPAVAFGMIAWWVTGLMLAPRGPEGEGAKIEALASWAEQLRDVLMAGDQIGGAIQATATTAPVAIRPHVRRLASRLARQEPEVAVREFADAVDDPTGDLVAAGLLVALRRAGRAVPLLTSLAGQARRQVERRKQVEAEREPARREVRVVTVLMTLQVLALVALARSDYLEPYRSAAGQVLLTGFLAVFVALVVWVQRLSRFPRRPRFLTLGSGLDVEAADTW